VRLAGLLTVALAAGACDNRPVKPMCLPSDGVATVTIRIQPVDKIDLLFVIDNSSSMAAKQAELARNIPALLAKLASKTKDIHVGVITSSLGSHGTSTCAVDAATRARNDRGHLLPRPASACTAIVASPLSWTYDTAGSAQFKGPSATAAFAAATACVAGEVGEAGCGFEETWESLYHFLVDPAPYAKAEVKCTFGVDGDACGSNRILVEGLDEEIMAQRKQFLRADSVLGIVILSDENDASLKPAGLNWLPWAYPKGTMERGWAACANVPDDFEPETAAEFKKLHEEYKCFSCFENAGDPACGAKWPLDTMNPDVDAFNVRAWQQTQRFGYNFLWGRQRYVDALTKTQVFGSDNKLAVNPIYQGGFRSSDLVVVQTIVGVPPELVKEDMTASDWDLVVGPVGKRDPRMIESIARRSGVSTDREISGGDDLQYACGPRSAYPGLRHLRIARDLGISGMIGSVCSEDYGPTLQKFGDRVVGVLNDNCLRTSLQPTPTGETSCIFIEVLDTAFGRCEDFGKGLCTPGSAPCRDPALSPMDAAAQLSLPIASITSDGTVVKRTTPAFAENGNVYVVSDDAVRKKHLVCEVRQLAGAELQACINELTPPPLDGWCYTQKSELVGEQCIRRGAPGTLRFLGSAIMREKSERFSYCTGGGGFPSSRSSCG
jgi:hypothetical protein